MDVAATLREFFARSGSPFTVEGREYRGVFSPRDRASPDGGKSLSGELGRGVNGIVLLLAPPDAPLPRAGRLSWRGTEYLVQAAEDYLLAGEPIYRRAILEPLAVQSQGGQNPLRAFPRPSPRF